MDFTRIRSEIEKLEGNIGIAIEAGDGTRYQFNGDMPIEAASVIKLPIMGAVFEAAQEGWIQLDQLVETRAEEMMPGCGVLTRLHPGLRLTVRDLVVLMIIVSDNTATNGLIDLVGMDAINRFIDRQGLRGTRLRRELVSREASGEMLEILSAQQLNGKIPFYLSSNSEGTKPAYPDVDCAHKTGEDEGITHDVGILFTESPSILCFLSEKTEVQQALRAIQKIAGLLAYPDRTDFA